MNTEDKVLTAINSTTLKNNFKIITAPNDAHPVLSLQLFVRIGSCTERDDEAGYSHFLEHLVFRSTQKYPDNKLTAVAVFLGSNINAYTEFDSTCYYLTLSSQFMKEGLEILTELCRYANFSAKEFADEKNVILEEIAFYENDPEDYFLEEIPRYYFKESAFKRPIIGSKKSIRKASYQELQSFYLRNYKPENCFLVASGDFDETTLLQEAEKLFGDWQGGTDELNRNLFPGTVQDTEYNDKPVIKCMDREVAKPLLAFALPELSNADEKSHTLDVVIRIFANDKKSRLYRRLFVEEKLVDNIRVESFSGINDGVSCIVVNPKNEAFIEKIIAVFFEEFKRIKRIEKSELDDAKIEMNHSHRYSLEFAKGVGFSLGVEEILGDYRNFYNYLSIIDRISIADVIEAAKDTCNIERLGIFVLAPKPVNDRLEPLITKTVAGFYQTENEQPCPDKGRRNDGKYADYHKTILSSGSTVMLKKVSGKPTIGITAAFKTSQLKESIPERGINYLTSILFLYGNDKRTYSQLLDFCSKLGILISVSAGDEITVIKLKCFPESLHTSMQILYDIITTPLFPGEHYLNIQQTIISNLDRMKDYPSQYATYLWKRQVFGNKSNLLDREGTKTTVRQLTRKKIVNWHREHYHLGAMTIAIVGDIDFDEVLCFCKELFGGNSLQSDQQSTALSNLENKNDYQQEAANPRKYKKNICKTNNGAVVHVGGFCSPASDTRKNTAIHVLSQIMGGDINSRLYDELREKRGLAYNVGFGVNSMQHLGYFAAYAMVDKKAANKVVSLVTDIFDQLINNGVTEEELTIAKNSIRGQRLRSEESVSAQATMLASLESLGYDYDFYLRREERLQQVTVEEIRRVAEDYLQKQDLYIHLLV